MRVRLKSSLLLSVLVLLLPVTTQAGWLDSIGTIVGGHIGDLKSRFSDDEVIDGDMIATAMFRDDDRGQDALHRGSGTIILVSTDEGNYIQIGPDFTSTPGPDYHVYISATTNIDHEERFEKAEQIELGRLLKGSGASYYKLPEGSNFQSVTIWCKAFNEFITSADFAEPVGS
jgi:hypothetical protein